MQNLRKPMPGGAPAGPCLEYAPEFLELVDACHKHEEQQFGNVVVPARDVDGKKLVRLASELAERTRDLRVAIALVDGLCRTENWLGLATGLEIVSDWTVSQWENVHPQLEAEDSCDPTARVNILSFLTDERGLLRSVRNLTVAEHRTMGVLTLAACRDQVAKDSVVSGDGFSNITTRSVRLVPWFESISQEWINDRISEIDLAMVALENISQFVNGLSGAQILDTRRLDELLRLAKELYVEQKTANTIEPGFSHFELTFNSDQHPARLGLHAEGAASDSSSRLANSRSTTKTLVDANELPTTAIADGRNELLTIGSRTEAVEALDAICLYFTEFEPASPVPMLLQRAKRLVPMSFAEILRELSSGNGPSVLQQLMGCEAISS